MFPRWGWGGRRGTSVAGMAEIAWELCSSSEQPAQTQLSISPPTCLVSTLCRPFSAFSLSGSWFVFGFAYSSHEEP
jgi:hypothetical protein